MWCYTLLPIILNMSLTAGIVIVLVLLARLPLKKAPKVFSYALWAVVLFRLLCPVSLSSDFSLLGIFNSPSVTNSSITYIPADIVRAANPQVDLPLPGISQVINETLPQGDEQTVADPLEAPMAIATLLWLFGIAAMLAYSVVSILILRSRLKSARQAARNIYVADNLKTPFVLGFFKPRIYIPAGLTAEEESYIIRHEQTHIRRFDHIIKPFAFLVLSIHWFNPLVWVAFVLMSTDMELSCDERVIKEMGSEVKKAYSSSLLSLAAGKRIINGSPLAFGEGNVKGRIKNVLNFKKPVAWVIVVSVVLVAVLGVGLAMNPLNAASESNWETYHFPSYEYDRVTFSTDAAMYDSSFTEITAKLTNTDMESGLTCGKAFTLVKQVGNEWRIVPFAEDVAFPEIAFDLAVGDSTEYTLTPDMLPDELAAGNYRIVTEGWYTGETSTTRTLRIVWAEFTIDDRQAELTQEDVGKLAQKGDALTFGAFEGFYGVDASSNLDYHIMVYGVEGGYRLIVRTDGKLIDSVDLESIWESGGSGIDIRYQDIDAFISRHPSHEANSVEPTYAEWSRDQTIGADMASLDYASDDIVIFHGYFGLFVYDLNSQQLIRSLDLRPINCHMTQGSDACEAFVSANGNTVQLHPISSENMYVYTVADNTLRETAYQKMEEQFSGFVSADNVIASEIIGAHSYRAVKFDTDEYGYLHTSDWTLGSLSYVRGDMVYKLFDMDETIVYMEAEIQAAKECVSQYFSKEATSRVLNDLWFDEEACAKARASYMESGKGNTNGVSAENVIVLICNFTIENDKTFQGYYPDWHMILIRDSADGAWRIDGQGY
ncbi:MAG: M56 family metallopeptidase [Oscillospiraceae bacterium]